MKSRHLAALALVASAGLALTGCGAGGGGEAASTTTLTFASDAHPISFDPTLIAPENTSPYTDPVYDRLINQAPDGTLIPGLALEWSYLDDLTFQVKLREGITFNNGEAFNADAVVANYDRLDEPPADGGLAKSYLAQLKQAVAVDEYTVNFELATPNPSMAEILALPPGIIVSPEGLSDYRTLASNPSGVGPYNMNLDETVPNQKYVYDKNPDYYNADAFPFDRVVTLEILDENARLNAIRSGQADLGMGTLGTVDAAESGGLSVNVGNSDQHSLVIMDHEGAVDAPLADPRVRQALSYAVDRQAFVDSVQLGYAEPSAAFLASAAQVGFDPALNELYPYDPDKAKELLAEAGYADGFTFTVLTEPFLSIESEALAGYFAAIGVTLDINIRTNDMVPQIKSLNFSSFQDTGTPSPSASSFGVYFNCGILDVFNQGGTPEMDELYASAMNSTDPDEQQKLFGELNTAMSELAWKIPISTSGVPVFYRDGLTVEEWSSQSEPHLIGIQPAG
ncbi:ABC transporter substrate-binding protein [soil metagenome]